MWRRAGWGGIQRLSDLSRNEGGIVPQDSEREGDSLFDIFSAPENPLVMRKRITGRPGTSLVEISDRRYLPIATIARVEVTSEDPEHPIEAALGEAPSSGWRAATPGEQRVAIIFDEPELIRKITLNFVETDRPRTHEFVLTWSSETEGPAHIIVRQQWTFSPSGCTTESETYIVDLKDVRMLELMIRPDLNDGLAVASLREWRIYAEV